MDKILRNIEKLQDNDGHWYWIPQRLICEFKNELLQIEGKDYMDCPDEFDRFNDKYSKYMTDGDPDLMPDYYNKYRQY